MKETRIKDVVKTSHRVVASSVDFVVDARDHAARLHNVPVILNKASARVARDIGRDA